MSYGPKPKLSPTPSSAAPQPVRKKGRRRRAAGLSAVALALLLAFVAAYAPAVLGRWILLRVTEDVQAERIGGPLWSPVLYGTRVELPGITAQAERLGVTLVGFDMPERILYVSVNLQDAEVALQLAELFGQGKKAVTTQEGWQVRLREVTVSDTSLTVDGQGTSVPDGTFKVTQARDGGLLVQGQTVTTGGGSDAANISAHLRFQQTPTGTQYITNFQADARVLRHYWQGVEAGTLTGEYVFGAGPVQGQVNLTGGAVRVPQADWAVIDGISGTATHSGNLITVNLAGAGYGAPVTAKVDANLSAKTWEARLNAAPQLSSLAEALGTGGTGEATLSATAHNLGPGWQGVQVEASASSVAGTLAGVPFENLKTRYEFLNDRTKGTGTRPDINRWTLDTGTTLLGEQQNLSGVWNFGGKGRLDWRGELLGERLDVRAAIDREQLAGKPADIATLSGSALGGGVQGRAALSGRMIDVRLSPDLSSFSGDLALSGKAGDLRLSGRNLNAAGFALEADAQLNESGLNADLRQPGGGRLNLNLDPEWQGRWNAQNLRGSGLNLSGAGALDLPASTLSGNLTASHNLLERALSGPINLNWAQQQARWSAGGQTLEWRGKRVLADLRRLRLSNGVQLDGALNSNLALNDVRGNLRGEGEGFSVSATGEGERVRWQGQLGSGKGRRGVTLSGLTELARGFATRLSLGGANVNADVRISDGLRFDFDLRTAEERALGSIQGDDWNAQGRVNLTALRPVLDGVLGPDSALSGLNGTLDLNLAGQGGTVRVEARTADAALAGTLRRSAGTVTTGGLRVSGSAGGPLAGLSAVASGQVYPAVNLRGPVTLPALGGLQDLAGQTLQARLYGGYTQLNASVTGRTAPLTAGGVSLPAQSLSLSGQLTPQPALAGRWGDLNLRYSGADWASGLLSVQGRQTLTALGRATTVSGSASLSTDGQWRGAADLRGLTADGYALSLRGPWQNLRVTASHPDGLRAAGHLDLPQQRYDLAVSGRAQGYGVQGRVSGQGLRPEGDLTLTDSEGGRAFLTLNGLDNLRLRSEALRLGGQTFSGNLRSVNGLADGLLTTSVGGQTLTLRAVRGQVNLTGVLQDHRLQASGRLRLPARAGSRLSLDGLRLNVNGPHLSAQASGTLENLRGTVTLRSQEWAAADGGAALILPQQTLPLQASLTPLRATLGGLTYAGGRWSGNTALSYLVRARGPQASSARGGAVRLVGTGAGLSGVATGALRGRVALLPELGGTLSADTALLSPLLPTQLHGLSGGQLQATFDRAGARLRTAGVRLNGQPASLTARVDWRGGFRPEQLAAQGLLNTGRSHIPFSLKGGTLTANSARVDVRDIRPFAPAGVTLPAGGNFVGDLRLSHLNQFEVGNLTVQGVLTAGRSRAPLSLSRGALRVTGGLLDVRDLRPLIDDPASLPERGTFAGDLYVPDLNNFDLQQLEAQGTLATGASRLPLEIRGDTLRITGGAVDVSDVRRWVGADLPAKATFSGDLTLRNLGDFAPENLRVQGVLTSGGSRLPLNYAGGTLSITGGTLRASDLSWLDTGQFKLPQDATFTGNVTVRNAAQPKLENVQARGILATKRSRLPLTLRQGALSVTGGTLNLADVPARLNLPASGTLRGNFALPNVTISDPATLLNTARADLQVNLTARDLKDTAAQGRLRLSGGQLWADVGGQVQGTPLTVRGDLYPRANATLHSGDLTARLTGRAESTLNLSASGRYAGRSVALQGTLDGFLAGRRPARAALSGTVSGAEVDVLLTEAGQTWKDWRVSGSLLVPDARTLDPSLRGSLSGSVGGKLGRADLQVQGVVNDIALNVPATFAGGELRVQHAKATAEQLGTATLSGLAFPRLSLSGAAELRGELAGHYRLNVSGDYSAPTIGLDGQLAGAAGSVHPSGLNIGGTGLSATLRDGAWRANLSGPAVSGTVRGQLGAQVAGEDTPLGLLAADLQLNKLRYKRDEDDLILSGPLAWNAAGWHGNVTARGVLSGESLSAQATGVGPLSVTARLGEASLRAELGRLAPARPEGWATLDRWDVGALWNRPEQLRLTGRADFGGLSWQSVQARLTGQLDDAAGELSGDLSGDWSAARGGSLTLNGARLQASAALRNGVYAADLNLGTGSEAATSAAPVNLARLLPPEWNITALRGRGRLSLRGSTAGSLERLTAEGLALEGTQAEAGPFTLYGRAVYQPASDSLEAALSGTYGGGIFRATGALPQGLDVQVANVSLEQFGSENFQPGRLNGTATLSGPLAHAALSGHFEAAGGRVQGSGATASLDLLGRLDDPRVEGRMNLSGDTAGLVYFSARDFDPARRTLTAQLRGQLHQGENSADFDLSGAWPKLGGRVSVRAAALEQPVTLRGQNGTFVLDTASQPNLGSGTLTLTPAAGWLPNLSAQADLNPLSLLPGAQGEARLRLNASGEPSHLQVQGSLNAPEANVSGVTVRDLSGTFGGSLASGAAGLSGQFTQGGTEVGTLADGKLTLAGLKAEVAGSTASLSGPVQLEQSSADLTAAVSGTLSGKLDLNYAQDSVNLSGALEGAGYATNLAVQGSAQEGWSGTVTARDESGMAEVLTTPARLNVSGPWKAPRLSGTLGIFGASAGLSANRSGAVLKLSDGVTAQGSGELRVGPGAAGGPWLWSGRASVSSSRLSLSVTPLGELARPVVGVSAARGTWQATGSVSRDSGRLNLTDGQQQGRLDWQGGQLNADLPGLELAGLRWRGLSGQLTAQGHLNLVANTAGNTPPGTLPFSIEGLRSPWRVDALNLPLAGDISGTVTLAGGRPTVQAQAKLGEGEAKGAGTAGTAAAQGSASVNLTQQPSGEWFGGLQAELTQAEGRLSANLISDAAGLTGTVTANHYPVDLGGQQLALDGSVQAQGQTFSTDLNLGGLAGTATLTGSGSLGAALPALNGLTAVQDTEGSYSLSGTLSGVDLQQLDLVPDLRGTVSGELDIVNGAGQAVLRSADLNLAGEALPARVEGLLVGGDWRIRGYLGDTDIFAGVSKGVLSGNAELQGLPLGAVANALAGQNLADGRVTGVARFEAPLADPLAGRATVVAERIRLTTRPTADGEKTAESETLTGTGTLDFANRELRSINVQMSGAGTWDIRGHYTREDVNLRANFNETTFTPLLSLVPSLAGQNPRLQGSLNLAVQGSYGQPTGTLVGQNLRGSFGGIGVEVPSLTGALGTSGAWTLGGQVRTGGSLDSSGTLQGRGVWRDFSLSDTVLSYSGEVAPSSVGTLPNVKANLSQSTSDPDRWVLDARSVTNNATTGQGTLEVRGQLIPAWDLSVRANNYDLPLKSIYLRESALNAALTLREDASGGAVRVAGSADFVRALLGRPDATDDLSSLVPTPDSTAAARGTASNFVSPLPEQYTTFPTPENQAEDGKDGAADPAKKAVSPLLERLVLEDIPVRFPGGIQLQESLAQAELGGALTLSGTAARPQIAGRLSGQRGTLLLRDNEFSVRNLDIEFPGTSPYPKFNLLAEGRVRPLTGGVAVPITLDVAGDFIDSGGSRAQLDLKTALRCTDASQACNNPDTGQPYTESQLYALVLTGVPDVDSLPENLGSLGVSALNTALNVFVLGELSRNLADALGVDVLRFTPALVGEGGATLTIGSQLTENLYLEYQVDLRGAGLVDATYNTPDGRFTFKVTTPFNLKNGVLSPNVSAAYNLSDRTAVSFNITNTEESQRFGIGVRYRFSSEFWDRLWRRDR